MTVDTGKSAIALRSADLPWMGLPSVKGDGTETVDEMLANANMLGWGVHKRELITDATPVDGADFEIVGNVGGPAEPLVRLGTSRERYTEVSIEDLSAMATAATDGEATLDTVGYYRGGRSVFFSFALGDNIVLDPNGQADEIGRFLNLTSSFDGTGGVCAYTVDLRLACQNQLTSMRSAALSMYKMRHTQNVHKRLAEMRTVLSIGFKASDVFEQEMKALIEAAMAENQFWALVNTIYPKPENDVRGSVKKWENKTDSIMGFWNGETTANLGDNAYKAYNALNEHLLWGGGVRDGNTESVLVKASGMDPLTNKKNVDLYKAVLLAVA